MFKERLIGRALAKSDCQRDELGGIRRKDWWAMRTGLHSIIALITLATAITIGVAPAAGQILDLRDERGLPTLSGVLENVTSAVAIENIRGTIALNIVRGNAELFIAVR